MRKLAPFLSFALAASVTGTGAAQESASEDARQLLIMQQTAAAVINCLATINADGLDPQRFEQDPNWVGSVDQGYSQGDLPISVSFPEGEGSTRLCSVEADMQSRERQSQLRDVLSDVLGQVAVEEGADFLWLFGSETEGRAIQFIPDYYDLDGDVVARFNAIPF